MNEKLPVTAVRLRERMQERGETQRSLASVVGATQGAISQILTGRSQNSRLLPKIAEQLAINLSWLMGLSDKKIEMFDSDGHSLREDQLAAMKAGIIPFALQNAGQPAKHLAMVEDDDDVVEIAHFDMRYGLGGTFVDGPVVERKLKFPGFWLRALTRTAPENLVWTRGDGDSMEPTFRDGDPILLDISRDTLLTGDGIWAFAWGDIGMVKRLRPLPDDKFEILSDNPLVPPATAADDEIRMVGRVVAVVRRF